MAKIKLGNVKGPKGDQGVRGSKWFNTANITGTSTSGTAFPNSGIASAMVGDMALNPATLNLYTCQTAGDAATAKWVFKACIKGPQGAKGDKGDPTTVDAALSATSTNPIQNKAVNTAITDVRDSLSRFMPCRSSDHAQDCNSLFDGLYFVTNQTANRPYDWAILIQWGVEVWSPSTVYTMQLCFPMTDQHPKYRTRSDGGVWGNWVEL